MSFIFRFTDLWQQQNGSNEADEKLEKQTFDRTMTGSQSLISQWIAGSAGQQGPFIKGGPWTAEADMSTDKISE